jgi:kynurenine 3-monooxygenase
VRTNPLHLEGKALLLGDAGHSVVPFFGEGMNSGFEDCQVLDELLDWHGQDWPRVFAEYARLRHPNVEAIADMALENFVEMRDSVDDAAFLLRKAVEFELETRFPGRYLSRHYMVSIRGVAYAAARAAGPVQEAILDEVCRGLTEARQLDMGLAERLIEEKLAPLVKSMLAELETHAARV